MLQDLCQKYKQSKGVLVFDGAYNLPEGETDHFSIEKRNSIDKSSIEALADSIWDGTKRRWRYEIELHSFTASDIHIKGIKTLNTRAPESSLDGSAVKILIAELRKRKRREMSRIGTRCR